MREFFELINEYPWTTFLIFMAIIILLNNVGEIIVNVFNLFKKNK